MHAPAAGAQVFFVFFMLTGMRDRELHNQMRTFFKFADKDGSGTLSLSEFQVQAGLAYPGAAWIREVRRARATTLTLRAHLGQPPATPPVAHLDRWSTSSTRATTTGC